MSDTHDLPKLAMFADLIGSTFDVRVSDGQICKVTLAEATELPHHPARDDVPVRTDPFSLIFKGDENTPLAQGTYVVENETLGSIPMFVVPVGFGEYQVIFA